MSIYSLSRRLGLSYSSTHGWVEILERSGSVETYKIISKENKKLLMVKLKWIWYIFWKIGGLKKMEENKIYEQTEKCMVEVILDTKDKILGSAEKYWVTKIVYSSKEG